MGVDMKETVQKRNDQNPRVFMRRIVHETGSIVKKCVRSKKFSLRIKTYICSFIDRSAVGTGRLYRCEVVFGGTNAQRTIIKMTDADLH